MTTRAGCECVAHALQALSESDPEATIVSIDGVSAFDLISRGAMMEGLRQVNDAALPFVRMFYGRPLISGSLQTVLSTTSHKAREVSRVIRSCPSFSHSVSIQL